MEAREGAEWRVSLSSAPRPRVSSSRVTLSPVASSILGSEGVRQRGGGAKAEADYFRVAYDVIISPVLSILFLGDWQTCQKGTEDLAFAHFHLMLE